MCRRPWLLRLLPLRPAVGPEIPPPPAAGQPLLQSQGEGDGDGSFWEHKPAWCQPWTILTTGTAVVTGSWLLLHRWWITLPVALVVSGWWLLFLLLVPAAWRAGQQEQLADPQR